jgi:hypothetical protein
VIGLLGAALSVALHAALLLLLLSAPAPHRPPPPPAPPGGISIIQVPIQKLSGTGAHGLACGGHRYNGLGFAHSFGGFVVMVGPGTPAERAGMQLGDEVQGDVPLPNERPTNTVVDIVIKRAGRRMVLHAVVESICDE